MSGLAPRNPAPLSHTLSEMGALALGGALGALARHALRGIFPTEAVAVETSASIGILLVLNFAGAAALGSLTAALEIRARHRLWQPFLGAGFFGAFTTYSGLLLEIHRTADHPGALPAGLLLVLSLAVGLALYHLAEQRTKRRLTAAVR